MAVRAVLIEGEIARVPLTRGFEAIIDAIDAEYVGRFNWQAMVDRRADGSVRAVYARRHAPDKPSKVEMLHSAIIRPEDGQQIDHINGDGLDNRRANLRRATLSENRSNASRRRDNVSGFKGVYWYPPRGKWQAMIYKDNARYYLGRYNTAEEAAAAYAKASREIHGEFGRT